MKILYSTILILFLSLFTFGCGNATLNTMTEITEDGTVNTSTNFVYDNNVEAAVGSSSINDTFKTDKIVEQYVNENNLNVAELASEYDGIKSLNNIPTTDSLLTYTTSKTNKLFNTVYKVEMKLNNDFINSDTLNKNSTTATYYNKLPYKNLIKIPGTILKSNATVANGNILEWNYRMGQINENTLMFVEYELFNPIKPILYVSTLVIILISFLLYKFKKFPIKKRKS